ncbi:MAG: HIT family protein [Saprospiraceae bacterium]|nr:HIT family protein [Saprospiraceae bacterium]MBK6564851.1 HIT family protein [Saprospiraceae bacterium]MBK6782994.1 HIT family protein [Saprospiraceae bacterium]MBK7523494.1 HIT family protein [Saprospiraceae bacterium]MBK8371517.1 HIT family protein [Saprospiraceae bacterium]
MASIFTKIILGEIPCYKVAENDNYFAFLDIRPLVKGHTLVIPKKEIDYIFDMEDRALAEMFSFTKRVAMVLKEEVECTRIGISVIGLEVPHAHVHLIPIQSVNDMNFSSERLQISEKDYAELSKRLQSAFKKKFDL